VSSVASDPPLQQVQLGHGLLAYTDEGPAGAPALMAVHGIPGSVRDFRYLAPYLTDAVRLVRVDLPGFGGSAPSEAAVSSLEGRARVLAELADLLRLESYGVIGHSMGGGTALVAGWSQPQRVRLVVLVSSLGLTAHRGLGMPPRYFSALAAALRRPLLARALVPLLRTQYRRRRFGNVERMEAADFALHCRAVAAADFTLMRRAAAGPRPPAVVAYAKDDPLVQAWISEELAAALPGARVLAFEEGGHQLQKTRAVELAAAIRHELGAGLSPPPAAT
jgi:pimeloyl-ACP methyl ester carboxylesterase